MAVRTKTTRTPAARKAAWERHVGRVLVEAVGERGAKLKVDREKRIIYGVKVLGKFSKNTHDVEGVTGSEYSDQAMKQACELYEGMTVRCDHPDRKNPTAQRSVYDTFGQLQNCRIEGDAVRADLHYLPDHDLTENVLADVESGMGVFGLSHNARAGRETVKNGRLVIEELELVRSVDLVDKPATNRTLWESYAVAKTFRQLLESIVPTLAKDRKAAGRKLLEDDGAYMDGSVEAPPTDPDEALKAGFRAAILAVLDDDSMDVKAQLKKIGELLKTEEKLLGGEGGGDGGGSEDGKPAKEDGLTEGTETEDKDGQDDDKKDKKESLTVEQRLDALDRKDKARDLCESLQLIPTKEQLADLVAIPDDAARKRVAEAYKAAAGKTGPARGGPRSRHQPTAGGRNVAESKAAPSGRPVPSSTKGWLNRVR